MFCNVVATSDRNDFYTLRRVTDELEGLVELSTSIAKLQTLFKSFIELCEGLVSEKRQKIIVDDIELGLQASSAQLTSLATSQSSNCASDASVLATTSDPYSFTQPTTTTFVTPATDFTFTSRDSPSGMDPGWELFDVQPTLDWLDADFSFFDSRQRQQG